MYFRNPMWNFRKKRFFEFRKGFENHGHFFENLTFKNAIFWLSWSIYREKKCSWALIAIKFGNCCQRFQGFFSSNKGIRPFRNPLEIRFFFRKCRIGLWKYILLSFQNGFDFKNPSTFFPGPLWYLDSHIQVYSAPWVGLSLDQVPFLGLVLGVIK